MASFRFRLQKILELREHEEEAAQRVLGGLQRRVQAAERSLENVRRARRDHDRRCEDLGERPVSVLELRARLQTSESLRAAEEAAERQRRSALDDVDRAREALVEAHRKVEALRRLREKALDRWKIEMNAQERKILDDISNRYGDERLGPAASPARSSR